MTVPKEIICQHCKKAMPFSAGFLHDADLNLVCYHCSKIVFGVTESGEADAKKGITYTSSVSVYKKEPVPIKINGETIHEPPEPVTATPAFSGDDSKTIKIEDYGCYA